MQEHSCLAAWPRALPRRGCSSVTPVRAAGLVPWLAAAAAAAAVAALREAEPCGAAVLSAAPSKAAAAAARAVDALAALLRVRRWPPGGRRAGGLCRGRAPPAPAARRCAALPAWLTPGRAEP